MDPIKALVYTAVINGIVAVPILIVIMFTTWVVIDCYFEPQVESLVTNVLL